MAGFEMIDGVMVIDGKSFPWASEVRDTDQHRGAKLMLESGWELSIIWGSYAYCSNKEYGLDHFDRAFGSVKAITGVPTASPDAEIGIISKDGELVDCWNNDDTVIGYCSPEFVLAVLADLMRGDLPTPETLAMAT